MSKTNDLHLLAQIKASIKTSFYALADAEQALHMKAYMLNQFEFVGIRATPRRQALKAALQSYPKTVFSSGLVLKLADALWRLPEREFQYAAIDLLDWHHKKMSVDDLPHLLELVQQKSWWDTVDGLAGVVGDVLLQALPADPAAQHLMDESLTHPHLWVRRVAMLHQLGWRGAVDESRLFRYALTLAPETDFFIRKAIGWALRDYARTQPQAVREFLQAHQHQLSGLSLREAGKHL